ncbi:MAG: hypothetical protein ACI33S_04035 [Bacilli bacterium]
MDITEDLYLKKIIEEDTFEDLQDTYEFSKNDDYEQDKYDFEMGTLQMYVNVLLYDLIQRRNLLWNF